MIAHGPAPCSLVPVLVCGNGHPVKKRKKLKAWQGHVHSGSRECDRCGKAIGRNEFRWRCEYHCAYNVCERCYDEYWTLRTAKVSKIDDPPNRSQLPSQVPAAMRGQSEFQESQRNSLALGLARGCGPSATTSTDADAFIHRQEQALSFVTVRLGAFFEVAGWVTVLAVASRLISTATNLLLGGEKPAFPYPWVTVTITSIIAWVVCSLVNTLFGPIFANKGEVHWKAIGLLGILRGFDVGLVAVGRQSTPPVLRSIIHSLLPVLILLAGFLVGTERPHGQRCSCARPGSYFQLVAAVGFVTVAGVLTRLGSGGGAAGGFLAPDGGEVDSNSVLALLLAMGILALRWTLIQSVLANSSPSPLVLSRRILPASAILSFEAAFWCEFRQGGFTGALHQPAWQLAVILGAGAAFAMSLVAEVRLLELTSSTFLGFLAPLCQVATTLLEAIPPGAHMPSLVSCAGVLSCAGALWLYWRSRVWQNEAIGNESVGEVDYERLDAAGARPRVWRLY